MSRSASPLWQGVADALPLFLPALPFALVFGVVITDSGLATWLGWGSSLAVYSGAAQVSLISLLGEGASIAAACSAGLIVGARHLLYSVTLAPRFAGQPTWFRWVGSYFLVDQLFALSMLRHDQDPRDFRHYYLGAGLTFWSLWVLATALGLFVGPMVPAQWELSFAAPVLFTALLVMAIDRWEKAAVALVSASLTLAFAGLPNKLGLLAGALLALVFGMLLDRLRSRRR